MPTFIAPVLNYGILAPILIVLAGALIGVLVEAFAPRKSRSSSQLFIAVLTLLIALVALFRTRGVYSAKAAMSSPSPAIYKASQPRWLWVRKTCALKFVKWSSHRAFAPRGCLHITASTSRPQKMRQSSPRSATICLSAYRPDTARMAV